ncbi:tetratricopeptide repeat protein [Marinospirillum alkaliphilum]|uniref:Type IV pilus assembly protein PilF n=1 Tax=Marinospirillum alkaliphilum DSM 21637 TaxID=1122209 RepID=A0A1K1UZ23_9GAMM|nr:tetratricopeptide repeat protein [Marinospirillum alkaliphilum]SFX17581.1 type IV pilus assembly protein PilF [Marinospirillum alkaliphilum DSM 21637]
MTRIALLLISLLLLSGCATKPPWEQTDPEQQATAYANLGMGYLDEGQPQRALREFRRALEVRPRHPRALHGMALALQQQEEHQLAEDYFKRALRADPTKTVARNNYAAFLFEQSRYDEARRELERAVQDVNYLNRSQLFVNLGYVMLRLDNTTAATDAFNRAVILARNEGRSSPSAHRELLSIHFQQGRLREAEQQWQILRNLGVRDEPTLQQALLLAERTGNQREQQYIKELLSTASNNPDPAN